MYINIGVEAPVTVLETSAGILNLIRRASDVQSELQNPQVTNMTDFRL
jgi:hypothetical protein